MPKPSLKERILAAEDMTSEIVEVPEWGDVRIEVRSPSAKFRSRLMRQFIDPETGELNYELMYPSLLIATCHDPETGEKVFEDGDIDALNQKNGSLVERIAQAAMRVSGMGADAVDTGKADSSSTPNSDTPTS